MTATENTDNKAGYINGILAMHQLNDQQVCISGCDPDESIEAEGLSPAALERRHHSEVIAALLDRAHSEGWNRAAHEADRQWLIGNQSTQKLIDANPYPKKEPLV